MKIAIYQFSPKFGEKKKNLTTIENAVQKTDADIIVLPELCTTGYQFNSVKEVAELSETVPQGHTVQKMIHISKRQKAYIVAGIAEKDGEDIFNSSILTGPDGYIGRYRKVHLFCEEEKWFEPGNEGFKVWDIGEVKLGMMICFDWLFPEAARSLALQGADIICHPVNLVLPFCQKAMITRSIENGVFTITANRIGIEQRHGKEKLTFTGQSQVVDPKGKIIFSLGDNLESLQEAVIDPHISRNKQITSANHILNDRRVSQYSL